MPQSKAYYICNNIIEITIQFVNIMKIETKIKNRPVVVVKWSAGSPSVPTIRDQIPLKSTVFFCKLFEKKENKQK